jgi:pantoate--beta-alanine ligase
MSSRNVYLSPEERTAALVLSRGLGEAGAVIAAGERRGPAVARLVREMIAGEPLARLEYVEIVDTEELRPLENLAGEVLVAAAVRIGTTRLIDNIRITVEEPGRLRG